MTKPGARAKLTRLMKADTISKKRKKVVMLELIKK